MNNSTLYEMDFIIKDSEDLQVVYNTSRSLDFIVNNFEEQITFITQKYRDTTWGDIMRTYTTWEEVYNNNLIWDSVYKS